MMIVARVNRWSLFHCRRWSLLVLREVGEIVLRVDRCSCRRLDVKWVTVRRRRHPPWLTPSPSPVTYAWWSNGARSIGGECVVVCVWSLIWGVVAVILHGSRRRQSVVWGGSVVSAWWCASGHWFGVVQWCEREVKCGSLIWGKRKKPYERKEKKTLISRASLSSHTGQPFITRVSLRLVRHAARHTYGPDWPG